MIRSAGRINLQRLGWSERAFHRLPTVAGNSTTPMTAPPKILIANRGEIACRVIRTCRARGIPTVAVYSVADGPNALHCQAADEAFPIGTGPAAVDSYLLADELLEIAKNTDCTLVHPGYGFLSENADFCERVAETQNMKFVGPSPSAIRAMGNKTESKRIMEKAGVPTTPGFHDNDVQSSDALYQEAVNTVGFPLLIKAVSGGGGKGMRLVMKPEDFHTSLDACKREAAASFKDDRVLLEKYMIRPRHVEVQIVADTHGNIVHLFERDCSMQRRHQKILEEAPASDLSDSLRERLGDMGVKAGQAVNYENAGTVEFLLDTSTDKHKDPDFYFCEMNTRLQVEHPITEMITGVDLVDWQLRVAMGEPLPLRQCEIQCTGHAFEARIYAENAANNFLPAAGTIWHHDAPCHSGNGVIRLDTGLTVGQKVSVYYDPMISKLIVHGKDRLAALDTLDDALKSYHIAGVPTNMEFLSKCIQHSVVRTPGAITTGFLEDNKIEAETVPSNLAYAAASLILMLRLEKRDCDNSMKPKLPWSSQWGSYRMLGGNENPSRMIETRDGSVTMVCESKADSSFAVSVNGETYNIASVSPLEGSTFSHRDIGGSTNSHRDMDMIVNGTQRVRLSTAIKKENEVYKISIWPKNVPGVHNWVIDLLDPLQPRVPEEQTSSTSSGGNGYAPMPGKITRVQSRKGDIVKAGDVVVVLEAMKMEHSCSSPSDGVLVELNCSVGDIVDDGALLFAVSQNSM